MLLTAAALLALSAACAGDARTVAPVPEQEAPLQVVATTNIVADWVRRVGGERVHVFSLPPMGGDLHTFQPGARDAARIADADLVVGVGLNLEGRWLEELIGSAAADGSRLMLLGDAVDPIRIAAASGQERDGPADPHFWFDPLRVKLAVSEIAARLSVEDPDSGDAYLEAAREYALRLDELHAWIQDRAGALPIERRLLVTSHDTLRYFALLYRFELVGAIIPGATTESEPSPRDLARLVDEIRERGAPAIFVETSVSDALSRTIAEETGARVIDGLYTGSLGGPDSGAETYIDMMRSNVTRIVEALK